MEIAKGVLVCMLGLSFWARAAHTGRKTAPKRQAVLERLAPALEPAPLAGEFRAVIDGKVLPSPAAPAGEAVTLAVSGRLVRAVPLDIKDRYAPYYLAEDGRMLETEWLWASGDRSARVRYHRGFLEPPAPG